MTREDLVDSIASLVAEYCDWDIPDDYRPEAQIMVSHLERVWNE